MNPVMWYGLASGLLFSVWPPCLKKSGIEANTASMIFSIFSCMVIVSTTFVTRGTVAFGVWEMPTAGLCFLFIAGLTGGSGILTFNTGASAVGMKELGILSVVMIMTQVVGSAAFQAYMNGGITTKQGLGFALSFVVIYLLCS